MSPHRLRGNHREGGRGDPFLIVRGCRTTAPAAGQRSMISPRHPSIVWTSPIRRVGKRPQPYRPKPLSDSPSHASERNLHPRRAFSPCRLFRSSPISSTVFEDRNLGRNAPELFVAEREQLLLTVGERFCDIARYCAGDIMGFCSFFHPCRDVNRATVDANRPLGIALLADDNVAAVHPDAEAWDNTKLLLIRRTGTIAAAGFSLIPTPCRSST